MNDYVARVICNLQRQYPYEPEYLQAVELWLELIGPAAVDPQYEKLDLISRLLLPWGSKSAPPAAPPMGRPVRAFL